MRLIDGDAVYKILELCEIRKATVGNPLTDWEYGYTCGIERAESEIECATIVDAEPVRHGKWVQRFIKIGGQDFKHGMQCSVCAESALNAEGDDFLTDYCPFCGAKMDGERKEE